MHSDKHGNKGHYHASTFGTKYKCNSAKHMITVLNTLNAYATLHNNHLLNQYHNGTAPITSWSVTLTTKLLRSYYGKFRYVQYV